MAIISCTCNLGKHQALFDALSENLNKVIVERDELLSKIEQFKIQLQKVKEFLESEKYQNPLYTAWEDGDIGQFDDYELDFRCTLNRIVRLEKYGEFDNKYAELYRDIFCLLKDGDKSGR